MANLKKCKHCSEEVAKSAKTCPKCGGSLGMPGWAKALIIIGVIVFLLGGCVAGCTGLLGAAVNEAAKETKNAYNDINGKTSFKLNESFENKYEKITMTEISDYTEYDEYLGPKDGNKIVAIKFEVENINEENDELYVSSFSFNGYADGVALDTYIYASDKYNDLSATVGKGKKTIGYVLYEVPKSAQKVTIEYNADFWVDGNTIEFIVQE